MSEQEQEVTQSQPSESAPQAEAAAPETPVVEAAAAPPEPEPAQGAPAEAPAPKPAQAKPQGGENRRQQGQKGDGQRRDKGPRESQGQPGERRDNQKDQPRGDRGPREGRGPGGGPGGDRRDRPQGGGRGPMGGGPRDRRMEPPAEIDIEKLVADSLYLDNQAHAVVSRMRDMDSGTRSQLRRLYSAIRRACRAAEADRQHQFVMLRARLAYTIARHQLRSLDTLEKLLLQVTRKNDPRGYERFRDLFEAIVAYNE